MRPKEISILDLCEGLTHVPDGDRTVHCTVKHDDESKEWTVHKTGCRLNDVSHGTVFSMNVTRQITRAVKTFGMIN